ncbi:hypothetical protein [Mycobacterium sp.]|jgi:hypothetical protein|uniref:hypothetical protein n=1 Tax=Mycobacterium sp. TaxID=1785 RepID=UPI002D1D6F67|nr:hypothetical protein [Mycobacterium sp.]HTH86058.1 hypothetical protein [Mycobacterium sp.]
MTAHTDLPLGGLSEGEMAALIYRIADELSTRGTRDAFAELLHVLPYIGERVGDAARILAASDSWSQVAQVSGTSKQAAWERWRT